MGCFQCCLQNSRQRNGWSVIIHFGHPNCSLVGACANNEPSHCAIIEPWNVPNQYMYINRDAMVRREELIPYIYTAYRCI